MRSVNKQNKTNNRLVESFESFINKQSNNARLNEMEIMKELVENYTLAIEDDGVFKFVNDDFFNLKRRGFGFSESPYIQISESDINKYKRLIDKKGVRSGKQVYIIKQSVTIDTSKLYDGQGGVITGSDISRVYIQSLDGTKRGYIYFSKYEEDIEDISYSKVYPLI